VKIGVWVEMNAPSALGGDRAFVLEITLVFPEENIVGLIGRGDQRNMCTKEDT
jgi:hypothetical protein